MSFLEVARRRAGTAGGGPARWTFCPRIGPTGTRPRPGAPDYTAAMTDPRYDRALGALYGLALGDALGMPTQCLSREQIARTYGPVTGLLASTPNQPIAPSTPAGSITDDTEQAVIVARLLLAHGGRVPAQALATALIDWERVMMARGSLDLLGPSTKAALTRLQAGASPTQTGREGTTNGAPMRITPVAIAHTPRGRLREAVIEASQVTHFTGLALSGAGMVAGAVCAAIDGATAAEALDAGTALARDLESDGAWAAGASVPSRLEALAPLARDLDREELADFLVKVVGTSVASQESVVAAMILVAREDLEPFEALCLAASLGGDTDTVAAMAGAVLGAVHGTTAFPPDALDQLRAANATNPALSDPPPEELAAALLALRA